MKYLLPALAITLMYLTIAYVTQVRVNTSLTNELEALEQFNAQQMVVFQMDESCTAQLVQSSQIRLIVEDDAL